MTSDDRKTEIGRMVEERRRIKGNLVCIKHRLRRIRLASEQTVQAIDGQTGWRLRETKQLLIEAMPHVQGFENDVTYPKEEEIGQLLKDQEWSQKRLSELDRDLAALGC